MMGTMSPIAGMTEGAPSDAVRGILQRYRRIAVVGLSPRPERPSYRATVHMLAAGYDIVPVNPRADDSRSSTSSGAPRRSRRLPTRPSAWARGCSGSSSGS
jgi:hypothetical protein